MQLSDSTETFDDLQKEWRLLAKAMPPVDTCDIDNRLAALAQRCRYGQIHDVACREGVGFYDYGTVKSDLDDGLHPQDDGIQGDYSDH